MASSTSDEPHSEDLSRPIGDAEARARFNAMGLDVDMLQQRCGETLKLTEEVLRLVEGLARACDEHNLRVQGRSIN